MERENGRWVFSSQRRLAFGRIRGEGRLCPVLSRCQFRSKIRPEYILALENLRAAADLDGWLSEMGVEHLFLKGPLLGLRAFGGVEYRTVGDIDVLVRPNAVDVIAAACLQIWCRGLARTRGRCSTSAGDRSPGEAECPKFLPFRVFARLQARSTGRLTRRSVPPNPKRSASRFLADAYAATGC